MNNTNPSVIVMNPWYAFIALPLVVLTIIFFFHIPKQKRLWKKNLISLFLHFVISATLTLTFVDIQYLYTSKETELVILADCSDSEADVKEKIESVIDNVYEKKDSATKVCVLAYAKEVEKVTDFGGKYNDGILKIFDSTTFDRSSTNFEKALKFANTLYSKETVRRMLIISDGIETDGSASNVLDDLLQNEVSIDCVFTSENKAEDSNEIAVTGVDYVDKVFLNREQKLTVSLRTFKEAQISLHLWKNGMDIDHIDTQVNRGLNKLEFDLPSNEEGEFEYKVTVEKQEGEASLKDHYEKNNQMSFVQSVTNDFKVLLLNDNADKSIKDVLVTMGVFSSDTDVTEYYYGDNAIYDLLTKNGENPILSGMLAYDEFIFYDVKAQLIPHHQEFISALFTCVASYGKTLQSFGNTNLREIESFPALETYADMLPIQLEGSSEKAVVLNIDVSGSMSGNSLQQAKDGAIACLDILEDNDFIGITSFSDSGYVNQPLTSVNDTASIISNINRMETIGGTEMNAGLTLAEELLANTTFEYKYCITLSDGEPFESEEELIEQVRKMADQNIICTFINIDNPSGESLLQTLATHGYGEYYFCQDVNELVDVMIEACSIRSLDSQMTVKNGADPFPVIVREKDDPTMKGINPDELTTINGFYVARYKNDAKNVLSTQYRVIEDGEVKQTVSVPLYSYWKFGKGIVSAFTSNLGAWTSVFRSTTDAKKFFQNAWNNNLPERAAHEQLQFTYETKGSTTDVHVYAADPDTNANVTLTVKTPDNKEAKYQLFYDGKQYSANIPTEVIGTYAVNVNYIHHKEYQNGEVVEELLGKEDFNLYFDYSSEYNVFDVTEGELLYQLATTRDNVTIDEADYAALNQEIEYRSYRSTNMWFLLGTLGLFLADVFVRKGEAKKKKAEHNIGVNVSM